jgi:voltage-gated potassium channel
VILCSLGLISFTIGHVSAEIIKYMEKKKLGLHGLDKENHTIVIGWNEFSKNVIDQLILTQKNIVVVVNSKNDIDLITNLYDQGQVFVMFAENSNYESLENINIRKSNAVFLSLESDSEMLVYTLNLMKVYGSLNIIIAINHTDLQVAFQQAGVKHVILKNDIASKISASYIYEPDVAVFTEDLISTASKNADYDIQEYKINENSVCVNCDYLESFIKMKKDYNVVLIGMSKFINGKWEVVKNPTSGTNIEPNDYIILIGSGVTKEKLEKALSVSEGRLD